MHFFVIKASSATHPIAYVSCWINESVRDYAWEKAEKYLSENGWKVGEVLEDYPITRDVYLRKPDQKGLEYFDQALVDDEVFVAHVVKKNPGIGRAIRKRRKK